jgi:hypothetical protein
MDFLLRIFKLNAFDTTGPGAYARLIYILYHPKRVLKYCHLHRLFSYNIENKLLIMIFYIKVH